MPVCLLSITLWLPFLARTSSITNLPYYYSKVWPNLAVVIALSDWSPTHNDYRVVLKLVFSNRKSRNSEYYKLGLLIWV